MAYLTLMMSLMMAMTCIIYRISPHICQRSVMECILGNHVFILLELIDFDHLKQLIVVIVIFTRIDRHEAKMLQRALLFQNFIRLLLL